MQIAGCLWSLPGSPIEAAGAAAAAGFDSIDVDPGFARAGPRAEDLPVTCVAVAHRMPAGAALDVTDEAKQAAAIEHVLRSLAEASELGASVAYVGPPSTADEESRRRYHTAACRLADDAQDRGIRLGIEHFPGRGLPTVAATLAFIRETDHPNLHLLLDVGHCQIAGESVAEAVRAAGDRLAYVHVDDNDGRADGHFGLLQGIQTEDDLRGVLDALREHGYDGPIGVETNPELDRPQAAFLDSLAILRRILQPA
jgi:sugar phosphate isomerase/epimerase